MKPKEQQLIKKKRQMILKIAKSIYTMKQRNHKKYRLHLSRKVKSLLNSHETYREKCMKQDVVKSKED